APGSDAAHHWHCLGYPRVTLVSRRGHGGGGARRHHATAPPQGRLCGRGPHGDGLAGPAVRQRGYGPVYGGPFCSDAELAKHGAQPRPVHHRPTPSPGRGAGTPRGSDRGALPCPGQDCSVVVTETLSAPPVEFDPAIRTWLTQAATRQKLTHMDIVSGATHDAKYMATLYPSGMVFVPCRGGISHHEAEYAAPADL